MFIFRNKASFYGQELWTPRPTTNLGWPPLVGYPPLLIQYIRSYPPYWRPFLHPQPDDAPCRGDREPFIMASTYDISSRTKLGWTLKYKAWTGFIRLSFECSVRLLRTANKISSPHEWVGIPWQDECLSCYRDWSTFCFMLIWLLLRSGYGVIHL
jgi:hypothetical protein